MGLTTARVAKFRHVVFTESVRFTGPAIDHAPRAQRDLSPPSSVDQADALVRWLFEKKGLDVGAYRRETLRRRVISCLRALRATSPSHARNLIERNETLLSSALESLLIGVTSLYRDPNVFEYLDGHIIPELARPGTPIRVWSAGCSHGAELYTVAMLLAERGLLERAYLLGTDCRPVATKRAAIGFFDQTEARTMPAHLLEKYFERQGTGYIAKAILRSAMHWRTADLLTVHEPGVWDMILCRNVGIYMTASATMELWDRFESSLRVGGYLVLGKAERPQGAERLSVAGPCIYCRNRG